MLDSCCSDDIVLSIASHLRPIDLLSLALTCRRFGLGTNEIMSLEDMTRKIQQQQMKYLVHMTDESAISISFYIPDKSINDNDWPECIEMFKTRNNAFTKDSEDLAGKSDDEIKISCGFSKHVNHLCWHRDI